MSTTSSVENIYNPPAGNVVRRMAPSEVLRVAAAAGFRGTDLIIAAAIALASSGGDIDLHDTSTVGGIWGPSVGLWRIRTQPGAAPGSSRDIGSVQEALANARAAYTLYQARKAAGGRGFEDWSAYSGKDTAYTDYLDDVRAGLASMGGEGPLVADVELRLRTGEAVYYGGPPSSVPAGGGIPKPGEAGFRPEGAQPPAASTPKPPVSSPGGAALGSGGASLGAGGTALAAPTTTTNPATAPRPGTNLTGAALDQYIRENYGALAWALNNPELAPILRRAAQEGWDRGKFDAALEGTDWWKSHSATMREIEALRNTDPAEFARRIDTKAAALRDRAVQLGIPLSIERNREIAEKSVTLGWDDNETGDALAAEFHYDPKNVKGQAASLAAAFKQQSKAFGVPVNDGLIGNFVQGIITGSMTEDDVASYFRDQAKSRYPFMASQIDGGVTPEQWFSPYIQDAARTLEMNPADLDIFNPLIAAAVNQVDPKTGARQPMGLWDYQTYLRSRPEWKRTAGSRQEAASLVGFIETHMGLRT